MLSDFTGNVEACETVNVEFQNACVICYAWWGQRSCQNGTGRFAESGILNSGDYVV